MNVPIALIVAMAQNRVIGKDNQLPWHLPDDLKFFKATTMGKPIIMGRKTYESIGKPLPGRCNIVLSHRAAYSAEGIKVARDVEAAIELASSIATRDQASEIMVIGGAGVYQAFLPRADRLYVTRVHAQVDGDVYFPKIETGWHEVKREDHAAQGNNPYDYSFTTLVRE